MIIFWACAGNQAQPLMDLFGADTGTASMVLVLLLLNLIKGVARCTNLPAKPACCMQMLSCRTSGNFLSH